MHTIMMMERANPSDIVNIEMVKCEAYDMVQLSRHELPRIL